ncbi:DUF4327 family protein [Leptolyngbya sp. FACHB-17]|uniref:DUF4327 family protein n=1 Tax=unclassified Leptolyngbya TaxID=2650499 RepID=UPI0016800BA6|nr:DUF4327 family protein [Leptolyngbya sp. FACHB-17]MBD2078550.1 DUF4327 family protein [Leptolyngbya sp. FACHB-17]
MLQTVQYSLEMIQDEVRQLIDRGVISKQQPIYALCKHIPAREWMRFEAELERYDFLLRDRISDLICQECWDND